MSDASRHKLYIVPEVTYGVTPATPSFTPVRHIGTTLGMAKGSQLSEELNENRQITDFRHGTRQIGGDINFELSFTTFDVMLAAALCGAWALEADLTAVDTISATAADSSFNDSGNGFVTAGFVVGRVITVSGFTDVANNGTFKIATVAAGKITVTAVNGDAVVLVDEAAGDDVTIETEATVLKTGVNRQSFSVLRHFSDQAEADKPFHLFTGVEINTMSLTVTPDALVTGTFSVIGQDAGVDGEAPAGSVLGSPTTTRVFNAFSGSVTEDDVALGVATELSLSLENGMEPRFVIGSDLSLRPSIGRSNATGSLGIYFDDSTMLEKFWNEENSSVQFVLQDPDGNQYVFTLPNISLTGGQPDVSGQGAVPMSVPFQAVLDATTGTQLMITRIPA